MARRPIPVFSLSFLDAMTCGFGAVVLFFMIINASVGKRSGKMSRDLRAEVNRLEVEVLDGYKNLVEVRNALRVTDDETVLTQGLSSRLIETLQELEVELATFEKTTLAQREHVNRLQADLKSLDEDTKRLAAQATRDETPGRKLRTFVGDGDRQYLTGLKLGGKRTLLLVDASASMLDDEIVNVIRLRNLPDEQKLRAAKWQQTVRTVDWLLTQIPRQSQFQVYTFNTASTAAVPDSDGRWLSGGSRDDLDRAAAAVRQVVPGDGTNLLRAFQTIDQLRPEPDNVILLTDGLPTQGDKPPSGAIIKPRQRERLFDRAVAGLSQSTPINVILFPMEGDPMAASAFWKLALRTGGSFLTPTEDWP